MKASAVAEIPPVISRVTPRSHVTRETRLDVSDRVNKKRAKSRSRTQHRREEDGAGEEQMTLRVEAFVREEVLFDDLHIGRVRPTLPHWIANQNVPTSLQTNNSRGSVVNMFSPKQNRATLIKVSFYVVCSVSRDVTRHANTHGREIVQDVSSRFVSEYPESGYSEDAACDERDRSRYVSHPIKAIECWSAQATVYKEGIVVANERKTDDADCLEHAWADESEPFRRISFQIRIHMGTLDQNGGDNYHHAE